MNIRVVGENPKQKNNKTKQNKKENISPVLMVPLSFLKCLTGREDIRKKNDRRLFYIYLA
jgi:hypothetical protein